MLSRLIVFMTVALALAVGSPAADEVLLKNGDRLTGKIKRLADGKLTVDSELLGTLTVHFQDVRTFSTQAPIRLDFSDGTTVKQAVSAAEDGQIAIIPEGVLAPQTLPLAHVVAINKPPVTWTGSVGTGFTLTRGNSETESVNVGISLLRRAEVDRITLEAAYLFGRQTDTDTDDRSTTQDEWFAALQYDYFFSQKLYNYVTTRVERDRIADLDLRLTAGLGAGYQWIESPDLNVSTEAGLSWLFEDVERGEDDETIVLRLAYHVDKRFHDRLLCFHDLEAFPSVEDFSDVFLTTQAGLRVSLTQVMFAESKVVLDYDSTPAPGSAETDLTYLLSLGVKF
jgi:putative salt-induced outer membrane protein YdiY